MTPSVTSVESSEQFWRKIRQIWRICEPCQMLMFWKKFYDQIQRSSRKIFDTRYGNDKRIHFSNNQFIKKILGAHLTFLDCKAEKHEVRAVR